MKCYCSPSSLSVLLVSFLYHGTCASIPFSVNRLFLIYSSLPHISTFHLYLTNLPSWHFVSFASEECGRRSLLSYYLHCSGYFLINATDKVVSHHLMQRQKVTPNWKFPLWSLILSLQILLHQFQVKHYNKMYFQWRKNSSLKVQFFVTKDL